MAALQTLELGSLADKLISLLKDPTSNLSAALILYGIIALLVLILLIAGIVVLMGTPDDEVMEPEVDAQPDAPSAGERHTSAPGSEVARAEVVPTLPETPRSPLVTIAVVTALVAAVWVLSGFTMSSDQVCLACHVSTVHTAAKDGRDPHSSTACVSCHESGGFVGRYVTAVPSRVLHFVDGSAKSKLQGGYGRVFSSACTECHTKDIVGVSLNRVSGVRVSHKEPLASAATCLDCHALSGGTVSRHTVGMAVCLRCHNSVTASSACTTCHDKKAAAAQARLRLRRCRSQT